MENLKKVTCYTQYSQGSLSYYYLLNQMMLLPCAAGDPCGPQGTPMKLFLIDEILFTDIFLYCNCEK